MDSMVKIYLQRVRNELAVGKMLFNISNNKKKKQELHIEENMTFYSSTISHSYYAIFFATKAILLTKNIKTKSPEVHKKIFEAFKK